jgi:FMN reductase
VALIVTIAGSPSVPSRSSLLARQVGARLAAEGFTIEGIDVRDLPAQDLIHGRPDAPGVREALGLIERAQGVLVCSPVYKAAYTGVLKAFLDLLPQFGLAGKVVLPLLTGGTLAHVLALDYGLRPVLTSLGAAHVVQGLFLLDKLLERSEAGALIIEPELARRLDAVVDDFARCVRRAHP